MGDRLRVAILEDEPFFRQLMVRALRDEPDIEVVLDVGDAAAFDEQAGRAAPDVVVVDLVLDPRSAHRTEGLSAAMRVRSSHPACGIVILSNHAEPSMLARMPAGALRGFAYLLKGTTSDIGALVRAIQVAAAGHTMVDSAITQDRPMPETLTPHQQRVLAMLAAGASNAAIAEALGTTTKSVEHAITAVLEAYGIDGSDRRVNPRVAATLAYLGAGA